jgi:hypothetical protein
MKELSNLLRGIQQKQDNLKSELSHIKELIFIVGSVSVDEKDISIVEGRGFRKVKLHISGSKKSVLLLKKGLIDSALGRMQLTLVL